jgi:hypothetical protein
VCYTEKQVVNNKNTMAKTNVAKKLTSAKHSKPSAGGGRDGSALKASEQKIVNQVVAYTIATKKSEITRKQLALMVGLAERSLTNALKRLKDEKYFTVTASSVRPEEKAKKCADISAVEVNIPTNNHEYHQHMKEQHKLKGKEILLFDELADGRSKTKDALAKALGYSNPRSFSNLLTRPKSLNVIKVEGNIIMLTDDMFLPEVGRPCDKEDY